MREFTISFHEIIINGNFRVLPHTVKYFKALGTVYLNRYFSIRNICRNNHNHTLHDFDNDKYYNHCISDFDNDKYYNNRMCDFEIKNKMYYFGK